MGENALNYTYDNLGRIATRTTGPLSSTYSYVGGGYGAGSTTPLVSSIQQTGVSFAYTYDNRGNIVSETRNGATTTYAYDALGQLIRVNDPHENATWVYNYDRGGNITSKVKYAFTTGDLGAAIETIPYAYGDANWKDKLTAYNGNAITYDAIGNPLNDGTWTYTWTAGRQLAQMSKDGMTVQYKYDHNGLRVAKIVNGVETRYVLNGKQLTHLNRGNDWMHFFYDAQGRPIKVRYNGTIYSYILNLQGDIVGIIDTDGSVVVEYKYGAWGKALSTTGTLAGTLGALNPLRYRGYIYDEETGLYYLRSRYYNPLVGRFVSADELLGEKLLTVNVFSYCWNRPITKADKSGKFAAAVAVGGWIVSGSWGFFAKILGALGVAAIAGLAAEGTKQRPRAVSSSNVDEQTEVVPAPGPAPTTEPSASPSPKLTPNPSRNLPDYPGDDPGVAPEGYEWRGRGPQGSPAGNYYNPETGESLHPDLNHKPPIGPHWDYWNPDGVKFRIFPPN